MKRTKRTFLKEIKPFLYFILLMILLVGAFVALSQVHIPETVQPPYKVYSYNYECDGKLLNDSCSIATITKGGVWIRDCESKKEYVCQSAVEIPK